MKIIQTILVLAAVAAAHMLAQSPANDSTLSGIETLYSSGQYLSAELEARRMIETSGLSDSMKVHIEKWIAFSLIAQGKSAAAKDRFIRLLHLDETFELDPVLTSPKILSVFNEARSKFMTQRRSAVPDTGRTANTLPYPMRTSITFRTVVFPGWEQLHQGRSMPGYLLMGAGALTLASGITFEFLRASARDKYLGATLPSDITKKYNTYNSYRTAEIYSFSAFALVYVLSEIEIFSNTDVSVLPALSPTGSTQLFFRLKL